VAGAYAAGYAGYVGNVPQAPDVPTKQHFVALRWHGDERAAIGAGAALAINAAGVAAGADTPPGPGSHYGASPHARLWPLSGTPVDLVDGPETSVAYAIDARGRVAGMLEDAGGRHRAFLWQDGRLRLLDDAVRVPGWRFECAYAIAANGAIAGIGVYRGTASAFLLEGL
jgi:probable HAF family extracellular repeat protein